MLCSLLYVGYCETWKYIVFFIVHLRNLGALKKINLSVLWTYIQTKHIKHNLFTERKNVTFLTTCFCNLCATLYKFTTQGYRFLQCINHSCERRTSVILTIIIWRRNFVNILNLTFYRLYWKALLKRTILLFRLSKPMITDMHLLTSIKNFLEKSQNYIFIPVCTFFDILLKQ